MELSSTEMEMMNRDKVGFKLEIQTVPSKSRGCSLSILDTESL